MTQNNFSALPPIAAISTPLGKGGVALLRISGEGAAEIVDGVFFPISGGRLSDRPSRTQVYGYIKDKEEILDDCLATRFDAGHSYTGEETVELSIHGSPLLARTVLELLFRGGALPAEAGEFTRRAFISGRLTLSEAEGIGSLIDAASREQLRLSAPTARGLLSGEISALSEELTDILSSMLARIDYPEEDLGELSVGEVRHRLGLISARLGRLISSYRTGRAIREGVSAVILGKPNAGKSTLYNLLSGEEAAIVTDTEGTTRDTLERTLSLGRVTLRLCDTAGIRQGESCDPIEKIGIERAEARVAACELLIVMLDLSREPDGSDMRVLELARGCSGAKICILNKADSECCGARERLTELCRDVGFSHLFCGSAESGGEELILSLTAAAEELLTDGSLSPSTDPVVSSARQHAALLSTLDCVDAAISAADLGMPEDAVASEVGRALAALGEVDGRSVSEAVVNQVFSRFCVGK